MQGIFLDIEATGLDAFKHKPIDIAFKIVDLRSGTVLGEYQSIVLQTREQWDKSDPYSLEINEFTWEIVSTGKPASQIADEIKKIFLRCGVKRGRTVFICQNPSFDRAFFSQIIDVYAQEKLNWPYHWLDFASMYWALKWARDVPDVVSLSKNDIAQQFGLPPEAYPHKAMNGVNHLIQCYEKLFE